MDDSEGFIIFFFRVENRLSALEADIQTLKEGMKNGSWPLNLHSIPEEESKDIFDAANKGKTAEENGQTEEVQEFISSLLKSVDNRSLKWFRDNLWSNYICMYYVLFIKYVW